MMQGGVAVLRQKFFCFSRRTRFLARGLLPVVKLTRISRAVEDREYDKPRRFLDKMQRVGEAPHHCTAHRSAHFAKETRLLCGYVQCLVHCGLKLQTKTAPSLLVSRNRFVEFDARDTPEDDPPAHNFRPYFASVAALISFHGTTSFGCLACSSKRQSSSRA